MARLLPLIAVVLVLTGTAVVHGLRTDRWGPRVDLGPYVAPLDQVAWTLGEWDGEAVPIDQRELTVAEAAGYLSRRYHNRHTGEDVAVVVLCGRPGPLALHTPEVCFEGAGYHLMSERQRYQVAELGETQPAEIWTGTFTKAQGAEKESLRVMWTWSDGGPWVAPDEARLVFFHSDALYKMYVIGRMPSADEPTDKSASVKFLRTFLGELRKHLPSP